MNLSSLSKELLSKLSSHLQKAAYLAQEKGGINWFTALNIVFPCTTIAEGGNKFLGKLIDVSLSATKSAANKWLDSRLSGLLSATDSLCI